MTSQVNAKMIGDLSAWFRRRNDPTHSFADVLGMMQMFPGVAGIWPGSVVNASGQLVDISGNGLHMTANNAPQFGCLSYNNYLSPFVRYVAGFSQYHSLASAAGSVTDINGNEAYIRSEANGFTFVCQVSFNAVPASSFHVASKSTPGGNAWILEKTAANNIKFSIFNSTIQYVVNSSITVVANQQYIITARFYPSTGLYLRVNNDEQSNTTSIPATIDSNSTPFTIGARGTPSNYFDGTIQLSGLFAAFVPDEIENVYYEMTAPLFGISI